MLHLVTYDLVREGSSAAYTPLINRLRALGATRILESTWLLPTSSTTGAVRDDLKANGKLDANDRLLVVRVHNDAGWTKLLISNEDAIALFKNA